MIYLISHLALFTSLLFAYFYFPLSNIPSPHPLLHSLNSTLSLLPHLSSSGLQLGQHLHLSILLVNPPRRHELQEQVLKSIFSITKLFELPEELTEISVFEESIPQSRIRQHSSVEDQFAYLYEVSGQQLMVRTLQREVATIVVIALFVEGQQARLYGEGQQFMVKAQTTSQALEAISSAVHHSLSNQIDHKHSPQKEGFRESVLGRFQSRLFQDLQHIAEVTQNEIFMKNEVYHRLISINRTLAGIQLQNFQQAYRVASGYAGVRQEAAFGQLDTFSSDYKMGVLFPMLMAGVYPFAYLLLLNYHNKFSIQ